MNISFWNTYRNKEINEFLISLIIEKNLDILVLAEYNDNIYDLINELYIKGRSFKEVNFLACKKIIILCRKVISIELNDDNSNYVSIAISKNNLNFYLFATHFPSKLYESDDNRSLVAGALKEDIEKHDKVLVVGDFNSNPFERTMSAVSGLLALPTKRLTERTVQGRKKSVLYNPMWKFFGDFETIPGTYYYNNSEDLNYYWNLFDQVLISHELLYIFNDKSLEIIKNIGKRSLIKNDKIDKNISDHLPISFSLEEKNGENMG